MPYRDFAEYFAYYLLEPWGEDRSDLRMAILASTMANALGDGKKQFTPADFIPKLGDKTANDGMSVEEMKRHYDLMKARYQNVALPIADRR